MQKYSVKLRVLADEHELKIIYQPKEYEDVLVMRPDVNRPGLQLSGFYKHFDPQRIQIMGRTEDSYLLSLTKDERKACVEALFKHHIVGLIVCHGVDVIPECIEMAKKYNTPLLWTETATSEFMSHIIGSLNLYLAPRETRHGVLVEVYGEGLLLLGESSIGKSETALELMKRGHRLIADDAVEIKRTSRVTLVGSAPEIIRYYMELRGIGIINARQIFGAGSVKPAERIDLVVNLESWEPGKPYDRLGIDMQYMEILGVKVPFVTIPVRPGRNLAVIMELAAMNNRQKKMGFNAALDLANNHDEMVDSGGYYKGKKY